MTALAHAAVDPGAGPVTPPPTETTKRSWTAYLLLLPGVLWLGVFFILPLVQLAAVSLQSRYPGFPGYYYRDLNFENYVSALTDYAPHFARSFLYAGLATLLAFAVAYPLAYAMAFKVGRWRNLMMICVIAPFFTSFILRTFAWSQILADEGWVARTLDALRLLPDGHIINTPLAVVAGLTYNFLHPADLHPGGGRLRQHGAARPTTRQDGRQRHQRPVPRHPRRLPGRGRAVVHADGRHLGDGLPLRPPLRHRGAGVT